MSIFYDANQRTFTLSGGDVSYVLHIDDCGRVMNLYWGSRVPDGSIEPHLENFPSSASFDPAIAYLPSDLPTTGSGWYGTPAVSVLNAHGDDMVVAKYVSHEIYSGKRPIEGLPATYVESDSEAASLVLHLEDALTGLKIALKYTIYEFGAITRSMELENGGAQNLVVRDAMAASVPLYGSDYDLIYLNGGWARERSVVRKPIGQAETRVYSERGASGHEKNPFIAVCDTSATEHSGNVWALNLIYSGSFLASVNVDNSGNSRMSIGMNPRVFSWRLAPGAHFQTPEAALSYSDKGLNGMSHLYHRLYRTRLVRGEWRDRVRPILINNWEATYFDFDEDKIMTIANRAKELGIEMFVLDDGWFGKRNIDNCSLGDWMVNREKLVNGLEGVSEKIHALGMKFGLWFEPEMISPDSDLYRAHPDWCLHIPGRDRTEERNQLILDLSRAEVQDYIVQAVSSILESTKIDYVKWDMNRNMTEAFSAVQDPEGQFETQHRYMLGLYSVLEKIVTRFPEILFESCSGGGGRFDAGMLYYMPQTWTSDDTDAVQRLGIQYGTSFAYPASAMGAHVSAVPNHQTGRITSMKLRGDVALGGNFGYELDLSKLDEADTEVVRRQVELVKRVRKLTQTGVFTRLLSPFEGRYTAWQFVSEDASEALLCVYRKLVTPMEPPIRVRMYDLDETATYVDDNGNRYSGAALNRYGTWIHLRGDFSSEVVHLKKV